MVKTRSRDTMTEAVVKPASVTTEEEEVEACLVKVVKSPASSTLPIPPTKDDGVYSKRLIAVPITPPHTMVSPPVAQQAPRNSSTTVTKSDNNNRPKVLCLGMSYASMERQLRHYNVDPQEWLERRERGNGRGRATTTTTTTTTESNHDITVQDVLDCVKEGMLTEMDARDLARCVATEIASNVKVYTVSQEKAALYDNRRHLFANFNRHSFLHQLHMAFATDQNGNLLQPPQDDDDVDGGDDSNSNSNKSKNSASSSSRRRRSFHAEYNILYRQAILDYFWIPQGWDFHHWSRSFFADILPDLVKQGMLEIEDSNDSTSYQGGKNKNRQQKVPCGVYLPFCFHCFRQIVNALPILKQYYAISFLRKKDLHEVSLWKGTRTIDRESMSKRLGKDLDQEDIYCTFGYQEVMQAGTNARDEPKEMLVDILSRLEDFKEIRMIKLRPLRQHHPSNVNLRKDQHERGGLTGLIDPKSVKRGFMATAAEANRNSSKNTIAKKATTTTTKTLKKQPSTPSTKSATTPKRASKATTPRKRGQTSAGTATTPSTKRRKKAPQPPPTPPTTTKPDCLSPTAKKALFLRNRDRLGMPTRSRARAFAAVSPSPTGPTVPLLDQNSSSAPRRSSRRNITFVSLPNAPPTRKRRQSKIPNTKVTKEATTFGGAKSCPAAATLAKPPGSESMEAPMHLDDNSSKENHDIQKHASAVPVTNESTTNNKISEVVAVALPEKELEALKAAQTTNSTVLEEQVLGVTPPEAAPIATDLSSHNQSISDDTTGTLEGYGNREQEANSNRIPAVTPSPSTLVAKVARARNNTKVAAKPVARRALHFQSKQQPVTWARRGKFTANAEQIAYAEETKPLAQQLTNHDYANEPRRSGRKQKEIAKEQVQSVLLMIPEHEPTEVSDTSDSVSTESSEESSPLVSVERAVKQYNATRSSSSVLESLPSGDVKDPEGVMRSTISIDSDCELPGIGMGNSEPGLTTQERLECLEKQLSPSSRTFVSGLTYATNLSSSVPEAATGESLKASSSSRVKKASSKLPDSSKARRQEWKARKKGGRLNRRGASAVRRRSLAAQSQSVLMVLFDGGV